MTPGYALQSWLRSRNTLKKWILKTKANEIIALQGRYGGTYAHSPALCSDIWASLLLYACFKNADCAIVLFISTADFALLSGAELSYEYFFSSIS